MRLRREENVIIQSEPSSCAELLPWFLDFAFSERFTTAMLTHCSNVLYVSTFVKCKTLHSGLINTTDPLPFQRAAAATGRDVMHIFVLTLIALHVVPNSTACFL